jgi:hypothetical protein
MLCIHASPSVLQCICLLLLVCSPRQHRCLIISAPHRFLLHRPCAALSLPGLPHASPPLPPLPLPLP